MALDLNIDKYLFFVRVGEIGFLAENRRMNVAVTRARRHLTIVGDSSTVGRDPFLSSLVEYISENGEVWSAEQYRSHITGDTTRIGKNLNFSNILGFSKCWRFAVKVFIDFFIVASV